MTIRAVQIYFLLSLTVLNIVGCAESTKHDEELAAKRAIEFAQVVLIRQDFAKGYELLSDKGKRHVSLEKFQETMTKLHPRGFPTRVIAKEFQPMPGENAMWIYLSGTNADNDFQYRVTMDAIGGDYKVLTIDSGNVARFFSPLSDRKAFAKTIGTHP